MKTATITMIGAATILAAVAPAHADDAPDAPSLPSQEAEPPEPDREQLLDQQLVELRERLTRSEDAQRNAKSPLSIHGYADLGFFVPNGNGGAGWVRDPGHTQMPQ